MWVFYWLTYSKKQFGGPYGEDMFARLWVGIRGCDDHTLRCGWGGPFGLTMKIPEVYGHQPGRVYQTSGTMSCVNYR